MKRIFLLLFLSIGIGVLLSAGQQKTMCIPPDIFPSADVTICNGETTTISVTNTITSGPYVYLWSPATGLSNPNISNPAANPTITTTYTVTVTDAQPCTSLPGFVTVTVNALPGIGITGAASSICIGSSATLSGTGGSTYSWSTGAVTSSITVNPTTSTSYTVWGTDAVGCSNTATGTVNVNALPSIAMFGAIPICMGNSATLTGNGGVSYSWSTGAITSSITVNPTTSTTYTVWGTDANGCSDNVAGTVTINALPTIIITGAASICSGNSATLSGSGGSTYSWSTGAVTSSITVNPTTSATYTVWGTDGTTSCTDTATATVGIFPGAVAGVNGTNPICVGQTTTLTATGGISYSWWNTGATSASITDNPTTTTGYTVTVTDANGCTDDDMMIVIVNPLPTANAGTDVSICLGSNTTLNATGNGTYLWSPSTDLSCTTCANPTANPTITTSYTVTVTNSCGSTDDSVTVTITTSPSVNAGIDATICLGGNTTLVASGSGTYLWSPSTDLSCTTCANPTANPTVSTNYTITITDGCGTASDSVWVLIDVPLATLSGTSPICNGSSSTLCATGGGTYVWSSSPSTTSCITVSPVASTGYTVTITDAFGCTDTDTLTVNVNALPTPAISGNTTICSGVNDTLVATGGTGYLWNTGATTDTLIVNLTSATVYSVTVTDGNGCSNSTSFSVSVNPQPTANAGGDATICNGNNTTLSGTGTGTYLWNPGGQTIPIIVVNPTSTTTYTFAVTNSCGTAMDSVVVNVNALPTAAISGTSTICLGSSDTLVATGGGTYVWNPTSSINDTLIVNPTSATGYTVVVTGANTCTSTATFTVNISSVTASINGTPLAICSGQSSTLTASGGGTYLWNTPATTSSITVSPTITTIYTVTVTNSNGCTAVDTETVTVTAQPTASVTATSTTICSGSSTTLTASGGSTYSWSTGQPTSVIIVNPTITSSYTVFVNNGACADTANILVVVNPVPTASITATSANVCLGGCVTLSASGGITYVWSPGGQTDAAIIECPTSVGNYNYTVTATDANGCTDNEPTLINILDPITLLTFGDTTLCAGDPTVLTAQGGAAYTWSTNPVETTSSITVSPTTSTTYTVIGSNACSADTATINVNVYPLATATATATSYTINIGNQTTLAGATSTGNYNWSPSTGLSCAACPNPVVNPSPPATIDTTYIYTLCVTDANGCSACDTVSVTVLFECADIFVPSAFSPNGDGKNDFVTVRSYCIEVIDFTIYNRWGQIVYHTDDPSMINKSNAGWDGTFHGKDCDPAVYFYILNVTLMPDGAFKNKQGNVTLIR